MKELSNGKTDALACQIESNKHLLTENTYLLEKCAKHKEDARLANEAHSNRVRECERQSKLLSTATAEIERLKFENSNLEYDAKQDTFMRHYTELRTTLGFESGKSHSNTIQYAKMLLDYKEELKKEVDSLKLKCKRTEEESKKRLDDILTAHVTLKSREAEANSYRDLYNELRAAVTQFTTLYLKDTQDIGSKTGCGKVVKSPTHNEILSAYKNANGEHKKFLAKINDIISKENQWKNKYRRLVAYLKRSGKNHGQECCVPKVLEGFKENEAALNAKRGKK